MINVLVGLWQFLVVWSFGLFLERKIKVSLPYGYRLAIAFGLGEAFLSYFFFLLGLYGGLRYEILFPLAALATVLFGPHFLREATKTVKAIRPHVINAPITSLIICILLLIYFLGTCVPEREVDALWYHLATPLFYIKHGGYIQLVPFNMPSHYPMNVHLHYAFSLLIGNDTTAKVFILCHFIPMLLLIWSVVKRYGPKHWGLLACAIYLSCLFFRLPVMANVQRGVFFYVFLSTVLLWYSLETRRLKLFILASVFCGMAMGTKFNALLFGYGAQVLLLLFWCFWLKKASFVGGLKKLGLHSLISWILMSPWMIKSYIYTHNPLYPLLGEFFDTKPLFVPPMESNAASHGINLLKAESIPGFFQQVIKNACLLLYSADLIFFLGIISLAGLVALRKKRWVMPTVTTVICYLLFTMLWGFDTERLFAVTYGVLTVSIVLTMSWISQKIPYKNFLYGIILFSVFGTFLQQKIYYLSSPNINWFGGVYLSKEVRRDWLSERGIFSRDLFAMKDWMEENTPEDDELYGYQTGYLFYLDRKYIVSGTRFGEQVDKWLEISPEYAAKQLDNLNVKWFLYKEKQWRGKLMSQDTKLQQFKNRFLEKVHSTGNVTLYNFRLE